MLEIKTELITMTDDKKGKHQSWEASLSYNEYPSMGVAMLELIGYGDCEQEAKENLHLAFSKLIEAVIQGKHEETDWGNAVGKKFSGLTKMM